ncbi:hypothetical protein LCGC14_1812560, partial [marine sediment metagenome]
LVAMRLVEELQSWFDWDETTEEKSINAGGSLPATPAPRITEVFYIKPITGTIIQNGAGTLTVEAHRIFEGVDELLSTGTIQLFEGTTLITVANGYAAGSDGYTGVFDSGDISGSAIVELKDGAGGTILDSETLVDVDDGADALVGFVEPENGVAWLGTGFGTWSPAQLTTDLDVTFIKAGTDEARQGYRVTLDPATGFLTGAITVHPLGDLNTGRITINTSGSGTGSFTVEFVYSFGANFFSLATTVVAVANASGVNLISLAGWEQSSPSDPMGGWVLTDGAVARTTLIHDEEGPFAEFPLIMQITDDGVVADADSLSEWSHSFPLFHKELSYIYYVFSRGINRQNPFKRFGPGPEVGSLGRYDILSTGTPQLDPDFLSNTSTIHVEGDWYLHVGVVHPESVPNQAFKQIGGNYYPQTGGRRISQNYLEFRWNANSADPTIRLGMVAGLGQDSGDAVQFTRPAVYIMDGNEPTIQNYMRFLPETLTDRLVYDPDFTVSPHVAHEGWGFLKKKGAAWWVGKTGGADSWLESEEPFVMGNDKLEIDLSNLLDQSGTTSVYLTDMHPAYYHVNGQIGVTGTPETDPPNVQVGDEVEPIKSNTTTNMEYVSPEEQTLLEFARYWEDLVREEKEIHDSKRHRYTGGRDPLENYVKSSDIMAIAGAGRTDRGALVSMIGRLSEKVNRIATMCGQDDFIQEDQGTDTDDEDFRQTCQDISIIAKLCAIDAARLRGTI